MSQPCLPAGVALGENGLTTVVTIGGCGRCSGFASTPWPISGISVRALKDIDRGGVEIGAEESLRRQFAARIAHQQPADRGPEGIDVP